MTFGAPAELLLFGESLRAALAGWQPPREPDLGAWQDDRDDALADRLADAGWSELWAGPELLGPAVAGGIELGRGAAPVSLVDEATLGAPLWIDGRARHGAEGDLGDPEAAPAEQRVPHQRFPSVPTTCSMSSPISPTASRLGMYV